MLRLNHAYQDALEPDYQRVAWNLEFARDLGGMSEWEKNLSSLKAEFNISTLVRMGYVEEGMDPEQDPAVPAPNAAERAALASQDSEFQCSQISRLMDALDAEVGNAFYAKDVISAFILANEPNLGDEWNIDGRAYGRVYNCYRNERWVSGPFSDKPLFVAGPGGCLDPVPCAEFYTRMFETAGTSIDGFGIHAYGHPQNFATEFGWQVDLINTYPTYTGAPVYITEYNPGARPDEPLPFEPDASYFEGCYTAVVDYNRSHSNQIKALLYFADSPDSWVRGGEQCSPAVSPLPVNKWWQTSLCYNGDRHLAWFESRPTLVNSATLQVATVPSFVMPGQIFRMNVQARNTGTTSWSGQGQNSSYRLGATTHNSFNLSIYPQCGGYFVDNTNARVYTCSDVNPGEAYTYSFDVRAPTSPVTQPKFEVRMVQEQVEGFGDTVSLDVAVGQAWCGSALTQCILNANPGILANYQNTSCGNRDNIVNDWCSNIDPIGCDNLKLGTGICTRYNSPCRCAHGDHLGRIAIDPNGTYCGYRVCGNDNRVYECKTSNTWAYIGTWCY
ncbi:hypothetical protein DAT35_19470 [Vitiosangium sp. GDMCC 1.1324]|nr:hypothetical protein DAT35_19470 [Vitiosangium sp. GDMCC 1.1324]